MLWQNADGHVVRKCHVDLFQLDLDRQVVGTGDLVDIRIIGDDFRLVVFIQDGLQRKFHVGRSQRLSIVEGQPFPKLEGIGQRLLVKFPGLRQGRHHLVILVVGGQACKRAKR